MFPIRPAVMITKYSFSSFSGHNPQTQSVQVINESKRKKTLLNGNRFFWSQYRYFGSVGCCLCTMSSNGKTLYSPVFLISLLEVSGPQGCSRQEFYLLKK